MVGALPPPVHGAAQVTALLSAALRERVNVVNLDTAPRGFVRGPGYHLRRLGRVFAAMARLVAGGTGEGGGVVYLSAAGGAGVVYDMMIAATARLLWRPLVIHHHSFAYVDRFERKADLLMRLAGRRCRHICLCPRMAEGLKSRYGAVGETLILSNAAFHSPRAASRHGDAVARPLRLGHLSNLSRDKGLDLVIESFAACGQAADRLVLGGAPVDEEARSLLTDATSRFGKRVEARGALAGADKDRFFQDIDLFLFPTRYVNEAEPLVVIEALAAGVPVIAFGRGCIPHMIPPDAGRVVASDGPFVRETESLVAAWARDPSARTAASARAAEAAAAAHAQALPMLDAVLAAVGGLGRKE